MTEQTNNKSKKDFEDFLDPENEISPYSDQVETMIQKNSSRLIVDLGDLNKVDSNLRSNILNHPIDHLPGWESGLKDYIETKKLDNVSKITTETEFRLGFKGKFGSNRVTPQELMSSHIGKMVCIEGIVTKVSLVRPKVVKTVHYCDKTGSYLTQEYKDATSLTGLPTSSIYPTTDNEGNLLTTEFGLCEYRDNQRVYIQDMPERTSAGSMPKTIECILDNDLVDNCKPGDRVQMVGIYRALASRASGISNGRFRTVVLINNVRKLGTNDNINKFDVDDLKQIKKLSKRKDIFDILSNSVAPSLYGHNYIKKALVLQLLGGVEKDLENGTHIRGDINILMVGDPSCGKSQLLRAVMNTAPLAVNTTGRGSSGVGLTAAITTDRDSGERRLEAGAMVLADRGVVCIDEFDKMSDIDRTAIHEVMEQQTVTIAKAGIHTSLNARCSVIAAANPVYGMYDRKLRPHENIGLPDSLLSRFDLLFIVLDKIDRHIDESISDHVLEMHSVEHKDENEHESIFDQYDLLNDDNKNDDDDNDNKKKKNKKIQSKIWQIPKNNKKSKYFKLSFLKKYIEFAKKRIKPQLTDEACEIISEEYSELRQKEYDQTLPITARCLESIIRLSTAVAKIRLSKTVDQSHVEEAMEILKFALTNDAKPQDKKNKKSKKEEESDLEDEEESDNENEDLSPKKITKKKKKSSKSELDEDDEEDDEDEDDKKDEEENNKQKIRKSPRKKTRTLTNQTNKTLVTKTIGGLFSKKRGDNKTVTVDELKKSLTENNITINNDNLEKILEELHEESKIYKQDTTLFQL